MTAGEWSAEISAIFRDVLAIELTSVHVDVIDAGLLDSLALVTLLVEIEERTGVQVPLERLDLDDLRTVDAMSRVLSRFSQRAA